MLHYGLFIACTPFVKPTVEALRAAGADLGSITTSGRTALHSLCMNDGCEPSVAELSAYSAAASSRPTPPPQPLAVR